MATCKHFVEKVFVVAVLHTAQSLVAVGFVAYKKLFASDMYVHLCVHARTHTCARVIACV